MSRAGAGEGGMLTVGTFMKMDVSSFRGPTSMPLSFIRLLLQGLFLLLPSGHGEAGSTTRGLPINHACKGEGERQQSLQPVRGLSHGEGGLVIPYTIHACFSVAGIKSQSPAVLALLVTKPSHPPNEVRRW